MSHLRPYLHPTYVDFPIFPCPIISTTSTVTILVVHDLTLGDEHEIANHVCVLAATQVDSTLLHTDVVLPGGRHI